MTGRHNTIKKQKQTTPPQKKNTHISLVLFKDFGTCALLVNSPKLEKCQHQHSPPEATPGIPESLARKGAVGLQPVHLIQCPMLQENQKPSGPGPTKWELQRQGLVSSSQEPQTISILCD